MYIVRRDVCYGCLTLSTRRSAPKKIKGKLSRARSRDDGAKSPVAGRDYRDHKMSNWKVSVGNPEIDPLQVSRARNEREPPGARTRFSDIRVISPWCISKLDSIVDLSAYQDLPLSRPLSRHPLSNGGLGNITSHRCIALPNSLHLPDARSFNFLEWPVYSDILFSSWG